MNMSMRQVSTVSTRLRNTWFAPAAPTAFRVAHGSAVLPLAASRPGSSTAACRSACRRAGTAVSVRAFKTEDAGKADVPPQAVPATPPVNVKVGDRLPTDIKLQVLDEGSNEPRDVTIGQLFGGKKGVLFGLPGAYTSICSSKHVPQFFQRAGELRERGVQIIACISVNDPFVMREWAKSLGVDPKVIVMLGDGEATFHKAVGLTQYLPGLGERARRYSLLLDDCVVKAIHLEEPGGKSYKVSGPQTMINTLDGIKSA